MTKILAEVRVSGGHLCGAEAPTEPTGEIIPRPFKIVNTDEN